MEHGRQYNVCHASPNSNDFILSAMFLRNDVKYVTIVTTELSNVLLSPLAECHLDDVILILL